MEQEMLTKIFDKLVSLDERLDGVDKRFDGIDKRFDGIDKRFDGIDKRFDGIENRMDQMQASLDRIEVSQREDIISMLTLVNKKLDDTATKADLLDIRKDVEFQVKESSLFKLELDRLKRHSFK